MIPETFEFLAELAERGRALGIESLVEVHAYHKRQIEIAQRVDRVYDFALPPLVLHAIYKGDARPLKSWLTISPRNCVTVLDTHDGIGTMDAGAESSRPGAAPGLLSPAAIDALVEEIHERSNGESRLATGAAASNLDLYQVNCSYYDALGRDDGDYMVARALQFFAPGVPQVYYVGLLAGTNDVELLQKTRVGRDINRHYYTPAEVEASLGRPVVQELLQLIRFRNAHPAFGGEFSLPAGPDHTITLHWVRGDAAAALDVDLARRHFAIRCTEIPGREQWSSLPVTFLARVGNPAWAT
jgi:sucrose phosphorylase